jgi:ADP-ribose pyrophosphatase
MAWRRIARRSIYETKFLKVYEDEIELPSGKIIDDFSVVSFPDGVMIVATDMDGKLIVQHEYKYAVDDRILTMPAGGMEAGEDAIAVAKRELLEETGYEAETYELVRTLYEYPSKATHRMHIVRAKNARKITDVQHEATEDIGPVILLGKDYNRDEIGRFNATYSVSGIALTLPEFL